MRGNFHLRALKYNVTWPSIAPQTLYKTTTRERKVFIKKYKKKLLLKKSPRVCRVWGLVGVAGGIWKIYLWWECWVWRMAKDGREDVRMWEFRLANSEGKLEENRNNFSRFQFMSHRRLSCHNSTSRAEEKRKMRQHSHHNFKSSPSPRRPRRKFSSSSRSCLDNDSDTEIKRKSDFSVCVP